MHARSLARESSRSDFSSGWNARSLAKREESKRLNRFFFHSSYRVAEQRQRRTKTVAKEARVVSLLPIVDGRRATTENEVKAGRGRPCAIHGQSGLNSNNVR